MLVSSMTFFFISYPAFFSPQSAFYQFARCPVSRGIAKQDFSAIIRMSLLSRSGEGLILQDAVLSQIRLLQFFLAGGSYLLEKDEATALVRVPAYQEARKSLIGEGSK